MSECVTKDGELVVVVMMMMMMMGVAVFAPRVTGFTGLLVYWFTGYVPESIV